MQSVAFSPDGARIASGSRGQDDQALGRGERPLLRTFEGHSGAVQSVAFSPDGARSRRGVGTRRSGSGTRRAAVCCAPSRGIPVRVSSVAFSPDGARIASGSDDHTIKLWDAASGRLLRTFEGHSDWVRSVAFSPDGARIASGTDDQTIRLWDAASGALLATLFTYDGKGIGFTPDGLFFGDADPRAAFAIVRGSDETADGRLRRPRSPRQPRRRPRPEGGGGEVSARETLGKQGAWRQQALSGRGHISRGARAFGPPGRFFSNASPKYLFLILFGGSMGLIGSGMVLADGWLQGR